MRCKIEYPHSVGDIVRVHEETGWIVVGLCHSDKGTLIMVEKEGVPRVVPAEAVEEET